MKKLLVLFTILFLLILGSTSFAFEKKVTLAWDHDKPPDLAGFKIYFTTSQGAPYETMIDVGMATACSSLGITPEEFCYVLTLQVPDNAETSYWFVATAYDEGANESDYSTEVDDVNYDFVHPPTVADLAASYDKQTKILTFNWSYETVWLPKIEKWMLWQSNTSGGPFTEVVSIPYDSGSSPPYTTDIEITVPEDQETTIYYVLTTHRGASNEYVFSANSNEVSVRIDKMPPSSPFEFKVKVK